MASPSRVHPSSPLIRCSASDRDSFISSPVAWLKPALRSRRPARAHVVEPDACGLDGVQRFFLHLDAARAFGRTDERAARDRAMVRAFGLLQRLERRGVFALP